MQPRKSLDFFILFQPMTRSTSPFIDSPFSCLVAPDYGRRQTNRTSPLNVDYLESAHIPISLDFCYLYFHLKIYNRKIIIKSAQPPSPCCWWEGCLRDTITTDGRGEVKCWARRHRHGERAAGIRRVGGRNDVSCPSLTASCWLVAPY